MTLAILILCATGCPYKFIPMSDGTRLAADFFLPVDPQPAPVVVTRSVYGRDSGYSMAPFFNSRGIHYVIQDTRGRGDSEGVDMLFLNDGWGPLRDGVDTLEWIRRQPWCNGRIGTFGPSAMSISQALVAPVDSGITCQALWVAPSTFYGQVSYQGGVWRKALMQGWLSTVDRKDLIPMFKSHTSNDEFWHDLDPESRVADVHAPAIHVGAWFDIFQEGAIRGFQTRQELGGVGARGNQKLVMGPWTHYMSGPPGELRLRNANEFDFAGLTFRFFDYWLKDEDNGVMDEPAVHYYTLGDDTSSDAPGNEWRSTDTWPPFPTEDQPLYLSSDGALTFAPQHDVATLTYRYDPLNPVPTLGGQELFESIAPLGPCDQRPLAKRQDILRFATQPLSAPLEVTGRVKVVLYISSNAPDTDFTAKLIDIYPDGRELLMLDRIQRVRFRNGCETPDLLPPGEIDSVTIDLWSISIIFNAGHRIGLHISSSNYPRFDVNPNSGDDYVLPDRHAVAENTVYMGGAFPSTLILPVPAR